MIYLFIKSYLILIFFIIAGAITFFFGGLIYILKPKKKTKQPMKAKTAQNKQSPARNAISITSHDINAIAGDDVIATQLDLARAYIETGKAQLAKKILEYVVEKGSAIQQQEARDLLGFI